MNKNVRRMRWGIRKQVLKNGILVTILCCGIFMFVLSYYGECSYLERFHLIYDSNSNPCKMVTVREILPLSATFLMDDVALDPDKISRAVKRISTIAPTKLDDLLSTLKWKKKLTIKLEESVADLPIEGIFKERKADAGKACLDMLNTAMIKESKLATTGDHTTNLKFSVGYTTSPIKDVKSLNPVFYNRNMLKLIKLRGDIFNKQPKYFQTAEPLKKNRLVYFHRIVRSPDGPSRNKVVEITWCPIYKAASTPWLAVFTKLTGALTNHTEAQIKGGKMGFLELAKTYRLLTPRKYGKSVHPFKYSMIVVRHPFKRLLSAYRDKIERVKGRIYYYNKYSQKIIARFRSKSSKLTLIERKSKDKDFSLKVPTFEEFVHYVLSTEPRMLDEHWRPMFLDCNPCHRAFDFILKVETLNNDKDKVMEYLRVSPSDPLYKEVEDVWVRWNNPSGTNQPVRNESFYFGQLRLDDIEKLYNLYEPDFKIFNYSPEAYFLMGKDD